MKKKRLIPILLFQNGHIVQSKAFTRHQRLGNPFTAVERLSEWGSDELVYLDISKEDNVEVGRSDLKQSSSKNFLEIIKDVSKSTFMPFSVGGRIRNLKDIENRFKIGADKIVINSVFFENNFLVSEAAKEFGSQSIIHSIDVKKIDGLYLVFSQGGSKKEIITLEECLKRSENEGSGEILINSIDRDGKGNGYDLELLNLVCKITKLPVIACGGVGKHEHLYEAIANTKVDAVAAANFFHYSDQSVYLSKKFLFDKKVNIRKPKFLDI